MNLAKAIVLDSGLFESKIGFAGDEAPRYTDRTIIGYSKNEAITASGENREIFIGRNAIEKKSLLNLFSPLTDNNKCDFRNLEKNWHDLFYNKMLVDIQDFPIFLTFSSFFQETERKKLCEILFESFNIPGVYWSLSNVSGIYAEGRTSGLIVDSGFSGTYALNIFEGY